jgi:putative acetyltransferase
VGDPNYYIQFGFKNFPEFVHKGVPQEVFLALPFNEKVPQGTIVFHKGFLADGWQWAAGDLLAVAKCS